MEHSRNILFIQAVRRHKCLYNHRATGYSDRDAQDLAWKMVAAEVNGTVNECKAKWKNLRGGLTRYLKHSSKTGASSKAVRKYYLFDAMNFLIPFTKSREPNGDFKTALSASPTFSDNENEISEDTQVKSESYVSDDDQTIQVQDITLTDSGDDLTSDSLHVQETKVSRKRKLSAAETEASSSSASTNPDMDFFKSILPDLAEFNPSQKRHFKQRVLQIIDEIATESSSKTVSFSTYPTSTYSFDALHYTTSSPSTSIVDVKHFISDTN